MPKALSRTRTWTRTLSPWAMPVSTVGLTNVRAGGVRSWNRTTTACPTVRLPSRSMTKGLMVSAESGVVPGTGSESAAVRACPSGDT